jgi:O-antigen/teichoic acid export membrane protein/aminoglycoside phosphotransferase
LSFRPIELPARAQSRLNALRSHLQVPLFRDGYALVANGGLTSALGVAYWLLAAHDYSARVVGINTAVISAMMFLSGIAQLNMMSALLRFLPLMGTRRGRLIAATYLVSTLASLLCAGVFLLGIEVWAPALHALRANAGMFVWFVAATVTWSVFNLQDAALTGLNGAIFVPVENTLYGIAKILLLGGLVGVSPHWGIFGSWTAGLLVSLVPVNLLIFARFVRRPPRVASDVVAAPKPAEIMRFAAPDFVGAMFWLGATTLMPVIVVGIAGATSNAYFSVDWMIVTPLLTISSATGSALVVTAARNPRQTARYTQDVLRQTAMMVLPASLLIAIGAPYILRLFGHGYAQHGAGTLALLAVSAIPNMLMTIYVRVYRVQQRMRAVVGLLAVQCGLVVALAVVLLNTMGIIGVGLAWLLSQTAVAVGLLTLEPTARPRWRAVIQVERRLAAALREVRFWPAHRTGARRLARCLPDRLHLEKIEGKGRDIAFARAVRIQDGAQVMLKLAVSDLGAARVKRGEAALDSLAQDARLCDWAVRVPAVLHSGELEGRPYIVEDALTGSNAASSLGQDSQLSELYPLVTEAISGLHDATGRDVTVDSGLLTRWVGAPASAVNSMLGSSASRRKALQGAITELRGQLDGCTVSVGYVHGDFVPENVLLDDRLAQVTGIVDWETLTPDGLQAIDLTQFLLSAHLAMTGAELGSVIASLLRDGSDDQELRANLETLSARAGVPTRTLVILGWLAHVSAVLSKNERYRRHIVWRSRNVYAVLDALSCR